MKFDISLKGRAGIYRINCTGNGRFYVGSAQCIYTRWHVHLSELTKGTHSNKHLLRAWQKYGIKSFVFSCIELCDKADTIAREQHFIDTLLPQFNICKSAGKTTGYKHSVETRKIMKERKRENYHNPMIEKKHTDDTKRKISEKAKARGVSPELVAAAKAANTGRKHSKEVRDKLAVTQSKITPAQAAEIVRSMASGIYQMVLAKKYGVSQRVICRVKQGIGVYGTADYAEAMAHALNSKNA